MFNLAGQAETIVTALEAANLFGTVAYLDADNQTMRHPCELPAAFVLLDELIPEAGQHGTSVGAVVTWVIIVRSKKLEGERGCLALIDGVIDTLVGLRVGSGVKPLTLGKIGYFDEKRESVAYAVRFETVAGATTSQGACGH